MRRARVQRLYVVEEEPRKVIGVLAYADILGMLYKYCHQCDRRTLREIESDCPKKVADHFRVCELMNPAFRVHEEHDNLMEIMETMSVNRLRTVLIKGLDGVPQGVVTTTDLIPCLYAWDSYEHDRRVGDEHSGTHRATITNS